jgi:hypothetical protein
MTRKEAIDKIIELIESGFETSDTNFIDDKDNPIFYSIEFDSDAIDFYDEFDKKLKYVEGFSHIRLNVCDSINDIINNNFNFN